MGVPNPFPFETRRRLHSLHFLCSVAPEFRRQQQVRVIKVHAARHPRVQILIESENSSCVGLARCLVNVLHWLQILLLVEEILRHRHLLRVNRPIIVQVRSRHAIGDWDGVKLVWRDHCFREAGVFTYFFLQTHVIINLYLVGMFHSGLAGAHLQLFFFFLDLPQVENGIYCNPIPEHHFKLARYPHGLLIDAYLTLSFLILLFGILKQPGNSFGVTFSFFGCHSLYYLERAITGPPETLKVFGSLALVFGFLNVRHRINRIPYFWPLYLLKLYHRRLLTFLNILVLPKFFLIFLSTTSLFILLLSDKWLYLIIILIWHSFRATLLLCRRNLLRLSFLAASIWVLVFGGWWDIRWLRLLFI